MSIAVKICGLKTPEMVAAAVDAGADYLGFVFHEQSPRHVTPAEAMILRAGLPDHIWSVAVTVDASDSELDNIVTYANPDLIQLHGSETPEQVRRIKNRFHRPVMKAIPVSGAEDTGRVRAYEDPADMVLFDAPPPRKAEGKALPGGNAVAFDWTLVANVPCALPWMLSGGLTPENVHEAIHLSDTRMVDVSSGVESRPGEKDAALIRAFVKAAKGARPLSH